MISSYNSIPQTVDVNGLLSFDTNRILTGCTVSHNEGATTFKLNKPGYYYITFNAVATEAAAGNVSVQLRNGDTVIPGAIAIANSTATTDVLNLAFATIIRVPPSCCAIDNTAILTIINNGIAATYDVANINITKLC